MRMKKAGTLQTSDVHVAVRVRPLNELERQLGCDESIEASKEYVVVLQGDVQVLYAFDSVFRPYDTNEDVYQAVAQPIVDSCISGVNGAILAYGQTASGKTFCIQGSDTDAGIIQLAARRIFDRVQQDGASFTVTVTYLEIYMEKIRDLLCDDNYDLRIREDPQHGFYVDGLQEVQVQNADDVQQVFNEGQYRRHVAGTDMNEISSRSHTIFTIHLFGREAAEKPLVRSRLSLADLAGSENIRSTNAEGERLKEGGQINKSLLALGMVISSLANGDQHVRFRDSKLTQILQPCLSGNCRSAVICCITPANLYVADSTATLKFASSARRIHTKYSVNEVLETIRAKKDLDAFGVADEIRRQNEIARIEKSYSDELSRILQSLTEREARYFRVEETMQKIADEMHEKSRHAAELEKQVVTFRNQAEHEIVALRGKLRAKEDSIEEASRLGEECARLKSEVSRLKYQIGEAQSQLTNHSIEIEQSYKEKSRLEAELAAATGKLSQMESLKLTLADNLKETKKRLITVETQSQQHEAELKQAVEVKTALQSQLEESRAKLSKNEKRLIDLDNLIVEKTVQIQNLEHSLNDAKEELSLAKATSEKQNIALKAKIEDLEYESARAAELQKSQASQEIEQQNEMIDKLKIELDTLREDKCKWEAKEAAAMGQQSLLEHQIQELRREIQAKGSQLEAQGKELDALRESLAVSESNLKEEQAEIRRLGEHLHQTREEMAHLSLMHERTVTERHALELECKSLRDRLVSVVQIEQELMKAQDEARRLLDEKSGLERTLQQTNDDLATSRQELTSANIQMESFRGQLASNKAELEQHLILETQLRQESEQASKMLSDEKQVAKALAEELEKLKRDKENSAKDLLKSLEDVQSRQAEHITQLELNYNAKLEESERRRLEEVETLKVELANLTREKENLQLGNTELVDALASKQSEIDFLKEQSQNAQRFVTSAESERENFRGELKIKEDEIDSLKVSLEDLRQSHEKSFAAFQLQSEQRIQQVLSEAEVSSAELRHQIEVLKTNLEERNEKVKGMEVALSDQESAVKSMQEEFVVRNQELVNAVNKAEDRLVEAEDQIVRLTGSVNDLTTKKLSLENILSQLRSSAESESREMTSRLQELQQQCEDLRKEKDQLMIRKAELEKSKGTEREELLHALRDLQGRKEELEQLLQSKEAAFQQRLSDIENEKTVAYVQLENLTKQVQDATLRTSKLEADIATLTSEKVTMAARIQEVEEEKKEIMDESVKLQKDLHTNTEIIRTLEIEKTALEGKVHDSNIAMSQLEEDAKKMLATVQSLENEKSVLEAKVQELLSANSKTEVEVQKTLQDLKRQFEALQKEHDTVVSEKNGLKSLLDQVDSQAANSVKELEDRLRESEAQFNLEAKEFVETIALLQRERDDANREFDGLKHDYDDLLQEKTKANNELLTLREELDVSKEKLDSALSQNAELHLENTRLTDKLVETENRLMESGQTSRRYMDELTKVKAEAEQQLRQLVEEQRRRDDDLARLAQSYKQSELERLTLVETKLAMDDQLAKTGDELTRKRFALVEVEQQLAIEKQRVDELQSTVMDLKRRDFSNESELKKWKAECEMHSQTISLLLTEKEKKTDELAALESEVNVLRNDMKLLNELVLEKDEEIAKLREVLNIRLEAEEISRVAHDLRTRTSLASTKAKELSVEKLKIQRVTSQLLYAKDMESVKEEAEQESELVEADEASRNETSHLLATTPRGGSSRSMTPTAGLVDNKGLFRTDEIKQEKHLALLSSLRPSTRNSLETMRTTSDSPNGSRSFGDEMLGRVSLSPLPAPRGFSREDYMWGNSPRPAYFANSPSQNIDAFTPVSGVTNVKEKSEWSASNLSNVPMTPLNWSISPSPRVNRSQIDWDASRLTFSSQSPNRSLNLDHSPAGHLTGSRDESLAVNHQSPYEKKLLKLYQKGDSSGQPVDDDARLTILTTPALLSLPRETKANLTSKSTDKRVLAERTLVASLCEDVSQILDKSELGDNANLPSGTTMRDLSLMLHRVKRRLNAFEDVIMAQQGRIALLEHEKRVSPVD